MTQPLGEKPDLYGSPPLTTTLDLIKETAWRFWVRHRHIPYNSAERDLFESVVAQLWTAMLNETRPQQQQPADSPSSERSKLVLALAALVLGTGVPTVGSQASWTMAGVAGVAFVLGAGIMALWGRK